MQQSSTRRRWILAAISTSLAVGCSADDSVSGTGSRPTARTGGTTTKATATPAAGPTATPAGAVPAALLPRLVQPASASSFGAADAQKLYEALLAGNFYSFIETAESGLQFVGRVATKQGAATNINVSYQDASGRKAVADGQVLTRSGIAYLQVELTAESGEKAIYRMARIGSDYRGTLETKTANGTKVVLGAVWRTTPPAASESRYAPAVGSTGNGTGSGAFGFGAGSIVQSGAAGLPSVALLPGVNAGIQIDAQTPPSGVAGFTPGTGDGGAVADAPGTGGVVTVPTPTAAPTAPPLPANLADEVISKEVAKTLIEQSPDELNKALGLFGNIAVMYAYAETANNGLQYFADIKTQVQQDTGKLAVMTTDASGRQGLGFGEIKVEDGFTYVEFVVYSAKTDETATFRLAKFGSEFRGTMQTKDAQGRDVVVGVVWKLEAPLDSQKLFVPASGTSGTPSLPPGATPDPDTSPDPGAYGFGAGNIINNTQVDIPSTVLIPGVNSGAQVDSNTSGEGTGGFIPTDGDGGLDTGLPNPGGAYVANPDSGTDSGGISGSESSTSLPGTVTPAPGQITPVPVLTPSPLPLPSLPPSLEASDPDILTPTEIQQQVDPSTQDVASGLGSLGTPARYYVFVETQANGLQYIGDMDTAFEGDGVSLGWTDPSGRKASGSGRIVSGVVAYLEAVMGSSLGDGAVFRVARFGDEYRGTMETTNAKGERVLAGVVWRTQAPTATEQVFAPDAGTGGNTSDGYGFGAGEVLDAGQVDVPTTVLIPGVNGGLDSGSTEVTGGTGGTDGFQAPTGATPPPDFPPYVPEDAPPGTPASDTPTSGPEPTPLPIQTVPPNLSSSTIIPVNSAGIVSDLAAFQAALGTPQNPASFYTYVESFPNVFLGTIRTQFFNDVVTLGYVDTANRQATGTGRIRQNRQGIYVLRTRLVSNFGDYGIFRMVRYNDEFRGTLEVLAKDGTRVVVGCVWRGTAASNAAPDTPNMVYSPVYGKDGNDDPSDWGFGAGTVILSRQVAVPSTALIEGANGGIQIDSSTSTAPSNGFLATDTSGGTTADAPGNGGVYVPGAPAPTPTPDPFYATVTPEPLPSYSPVPGLQPTPFPTEAPMASPTPGSGLPTPTPGPSVAPTPGGGFATPTAGPSFAPTPTPSPISTKIPGPGESGFVTPTPFSPPSPTPSPVSTKIPGPGESGFVTPTPFAPATPTPMPSSTKIPAPGESGFVPATSPPTPTPSPSPSGFVAVPPGDGGPTPSPLPTGGGGSSTPAPSGGLLPGHDGGMGTPAPTPTPSGAPMDPSMGGGGMGGSSPAPTASPVPTPDMSAPPAGGGGSASPSPTPPPAHGGPGSMSAPRPDWRFVRPPKVW